MRGSLELGNGMSGLHSNWEFLPLGHTKVCTDIQPGFACGKKNVDAGTPHLRMNNISTNGIPDFTLIRHIPKEIAEKKNRWLDVLAQHKSDKKMKKLPYTLQFKFGYSS